MHIRTSYLQQGNQDCTMRMKMEMKEEEGEEEKVFAIIHKN